MIKKSLIENKRYIVRIERTLTYTKFVLTNKTCDIDHLYNYSRVHFHANNTIVTLNESLFLANRGDELILNLEARKDTHNSNNTRIPLYLKFR
jgi:hypothetical protein